jgi:transglutaminase-like putative cysteine protease
MSANALELERVFKFSLYGLAMAAGLILGAAEGSWLPYGTVLLAVLGFWATESPGRFALSNPLSNLAGLIAVAMAGFEFFGNNPEGRLLAGTHLVVYATWIVFLQQSSVRKYWSICALSVLQVAVASVLTNDSWYGGALVAFAIAAMWTLAVFSLYHAVVHHGEEPSEPVKPLSSRFQFEQAVSEAGHSIQFDGIARWVTLRFVSGIATLSCLALLMSAAFYILTPRVWIGQRFMFGELTDEPELGRRNLTGFTQQVKLGDLGQILESLEPVMTIQAYDIRSGEDRHLSAQDLAQALGYDEPLYRGGIMTSYHDGEWQADTFTDIPESMQRTPTRAELRQEIALEPVAGEILFCFGTPVACEISPNQRASYNRVTGVLRQRRPMHDRRGPISYRLYTLVPPSFEDGIPRIEMRSSVPRAPSVRDQPLERYLLRCRELPQDSLPRLITLARALKEQEYGRMGRQPTTLEMATRLERYLRDSGEYQYTVNLTIQDPAIDPVEDFLFNRKTGHCEYFATALTLMLRAVDIPSRLMSGFKGGETNYRGQIEVQQRHAHAWVEAWEGNGRWIVLDPTPAGARAESVKEVAQALTFWQQLETFFGTFWTEWVMNFTPDRQREGLYHPLKEFGQKLLAQGEEVVTRGPRGLLGLLSFLKNPREWFSLKGLLFIGGVAAVGYGVRLVYRRLSRWWNRSRSLGGVNASGRFLVPFYERFLEALEAHGYLRPAEQTPAEFARDVAASMDRVPQLAELGEVPPLITQQFYRVRYGDATLNDAETAAVNAALERLKRFG